MRRAWKSRRKPGRLEDKALPAAFSEGNAIGSSTQRSRNPSNTSLFRSCGALLEKSLVQRLLATYLAGAVLGLAAVDLLAVAEGLPVVGDQGQVDRQPLPAAAQRLGEPARQGEVEAALQLRVVREAGVDRLADGFLGGGPVEPLTGGFRRWP